MLLSMLCTRRSKRGLSLKLCFLDVRRAYFYARATEEVYVELPPELREEGKDLVGLLLKSIRGRAPGFGSCNLGKASPAQRWGSSRLEVAFACFITPARWCSLL